METDGISVVNLRGEPIEQLDPASLLGGTWGHVRCGYLAWGPGGLLYVTLSGDHAGVMVLDHDHRLVRSFNGTATEGGVLVAPSGITVDAEGRVLVTDPGAALAVNIFSAEGRFLGGFGEHDTGWENFSFPSGIAVSGDLLWVSDSVRQVVKGMSRDGSPVFLIGGMGTGPGDLLYPVSVVADGRGRLFVLERAGARLQAFELPAEADGRDRVLGGPVSLAEPIGRGVSDER